VVLGALGVNWYWTLVEAVSDAGWAALAPGRYARRMPGICAIFGRSINDFIHCGRLRDRFSRAKTRARIQSWTVHASAATVEVDEQHLEFSAIAFEMIAGVTMSCERDDPVCLQ